MNNKATSTGGKRISADTVFINGNFITMAEKEEKIEFVAIRDEKIIGVGSKG